MTISQFPRAAIALSAALSVLLVLSGCSGINPPVQNPQQLSNAPTILVVPQTNGVGTNRAVAVVFSTPMDPASINTGSFMVAGVSGTVTYDTNKIAAFKPSPDFAPSTMYNATITTAARDVSGTPLAAPFNFSFTTRATTDTSPPTIVAVNVAAGATCVPLDQKIKVTFTEQMDSLTINPSTVFIEDVAGTVTYDVAQPQRHHHAFSQPGSEHYVHDHGDRRSQRPGRNAMAAPFQQTFTTGPCAGGGVAPVALCPFIGGFSVLAGSTVTNTGPTQVSGDVGISPGTAVTGFPPGLAGGAIHSADGAAAQAQATLTAAYIDAAGRSGGTSVAGDLVGQTLHRRNL